eukprot:5569149-Lingulodinium_polyedra.AAC.1
MDRLRLDFRPSYREVADGQEACLDVCTSHLGALRVCSQPRLQAHARVSGRRSTRPGVWQGR